MVKKAFVAATALVLAGCGNTVDTSTRAEYRESMGDVIADLDETQREELREALIVLAFDTATPDKGLWSNAPVDSPVFIAAGEEIDGLSASEIIALGRERRLALIDDQISGLVSEIDRVNKARAENAAIFDNILIDNPRYSVSRSRFMEEPVISFTITNNASSAIRKVFLSGVLSSPGRSVPWVEDGFNYEFSGGLEPGESRSLDLSPNMFGEWRIDDQYSRRDDLDLALELENVELANGETVLDRDMREPALIEQEMAELQRLRKEAAE